MYLKIIRNAAELVEKYYGTYYGCKPHHNIDSYLKSTITFTNRKFEKEFSPMIPHHVRAADDVQRSVYSYVALAEKKAHLHYVSQHHSFRLHIDNSKLYEKFERYNPVFFCMNDSEFANDADRKAAIEFLKSKFPTKSEFEK